MHPRLKVFAAAAAVAALTACPCGQAADRTTVQVAQVSSATLLALYEPVETDGTFGAQVQVDDGSPCDELDPSATGEVSGVELVSDQDGGAACFCDGSSFRVTGAAIPNTADATFRVADGSGEMTATAPGLFLERSVSARGSPAQLVPGTRVYLDVVPAGEAMEQVAASFQSYSASTGTYRTLFTFDSTNGTLGRDAGGWYFDVPNVGPASGQLQLYAEAYVAPSSCVGAGRCQIVARARGWLNTAIVAP